MYLGTTSYGLHFESNERTHGLVIGQTETGKTTLLANMIAQDIAAGLGVLVLDPHGGLIDAAASSVPPERLNDVIYIDPLADRVVGFNLFEQGRPWLTSDRFRGILKDLFPNGQIMARADYLLNNLILGILLSKQPHEVRPTIVALEKILHDKDYEQYIREQVDDVFVEMFFKEQTTFTKKFREEIFMPVVNKVNVLISNPDVRAVLAQTTSSFNLKEAIERRQIILCKLDIGHLGEDGAALIGSILITTVFFAALERREVPETEPVFRMYVDEFENFVHGVSISTLLSQIRKFGVRCILATQYIAQIPEKDRAAVFTNTATLVTFRTSYDDAEIMVHQMATELQPSAIQFLPDHECMARTKRDRYPTEATRLLTYPPPPRNRAYSEHVRTVSLRRWGRPKDKIEERIRRFMAR